MTPLINHYVEDKFLLKLWRRHSLYETKVEDGRVQYVKVWFKFDISRSRFPHPLNWVTLRLFLGPIFLVVGFTYAAYPPKA